MFNPNMEKLQKKFYLPIVDSLRFFAFFLVLIHHSQIFPATTKIGQIISDRIHSYGWIGVDLFLCISAYLITELLVREFNINKNFSITYFYFRRLLRICPLYYLALLLGFFILPFFNIGFRFPIFGVDYFVMLNKYLLSMVFFMGNYSFGANGYPPSQFLAPLWTISMETQFYILWPILLKFLLKKKNFTKYITLVVLLLFSITMKYFSILNGVAHPFIWTNLFNRLDPFLFGSLVAFMNQDKIFNKFVSSFFVFLLGIFAIIIITPGQNIDINSNNIIYKYFFSALGFSLILLYVTNIKSKSIINKILSWEPFAWLGKISYGLYVYSVLGALITVKILSFIYSKIPNLFNFSSVEINQLLQWVFYLIVNISFDIILAALSYYFFEKAFLKFKIKYTIIENRKF